MAGGQILAFPIDIDRRLYNTLALPCECVIMALCLLCTIFMLTFNKHIPVLVSCIRLLNYTIGASLQIIGSLLLSTEVISNLSLFFGNVFWFQSRFGHFCWLCIDGER